MGLYTLWKKKVPTSLAEWRNTETLAYLTKRMAGKKGAIYIYQGAFAPSTQSTKLNQELLRTKIISGTGEAGEKFQ